MGSELRFSFRYLMGYIGELMHKLTFFEIKPLPPIVPIDTFSSVNYSTALLHETPASHQFLFSLVRRILNRNVDHPIHCSHSFVDEGAGDSPRSQ
jgi:hypothetical protein